MSLILIIFSIAKIGWTGTLLDDNASGLRTFAIGVFYLLLGGYIKNYNLFKLVKNHMLFLIIIGGHIIYLISVYNDTQNRIQLYLRGTQSSSFIQTVYHPTNYDILVVFFAVSLFELFSRIRIPSIKIINFIAEATFMIYLIHENKFFQSIYNQSDCMTLLYNNPFAFMIKMIEWTIIGFCIGLLIYISYWKIKKVVKYKSL